MRRRRGSGLRPEHDAPIPYMQRIRDYYQALGYGAPYRWAHYAEVPFTPLNKPLAESRIGAGHDRGAVPAGTRATRGRARRITPPPSSTRSIPATAPPTTICASRISATTAPIRPPRTATPGSRCRRCGGGGGRADRRGGAALSRRADQPQPPRDPRPGLPRAAGAAARRQGRRRRSRRGLTGVSPDRESGRPSPRSERHPDRHHGMRQGHRRTCRRAAFPVQRLPARQPGGPAARPGIADADPGAGAAGAGDRAGAAHDRTVAAALERRPGLEARLLEYRPAVARGDRAPPRRIRPAERIAKDNPHEAARQRNNRRAFDRAERGVTGRLRRALRRKCRARSQAA